MLDATPHDDTILRSVHDPRLVDHLAGIWADWDQAGLPADYGRDRVVPYLFPTDAMLAGLPLRVPPAVHARAGLFCYDTMTLVGPGSWAAIRGAVDAALTAAGLVSSGARLAYALCRPPGHHATRGGYGGSCYLNNAAVAAAGAPDGRRGPGGGAGHRRAPRQRHADDLLRPARRVVRIGARRPGGGLVPALCRLRRTSAAGVAGRVTTGTCRWPPGTGDDGWLAAVGVLCVAARELRPDAVVVSLGLDAAAADPESPLQVTAAGYREACRRIAALAPAVFIQEGGYDLGSLGALAVAALEGAAEGSR